MSLGWGKDWGTLLLRGPLAAACMKFPTKFSLQSGHQLLGCFFFFFFSCVDLADCSAEPPSCCEMDVYVCVWGSGREDKTGGSRSLGPGYPLLGTICLLVQD